MNTLPVLPVRTRVRTALSGLFLLLAVFCIPLARAQALDATQLEWLGAQIYRNECNSQPACLTAWNAGEEFPSLGIGHFIWYRAGQHAAFVETFPDLLAFMSARGAKLPHWLAQPSVEQPWTSREDFLGAIAAGDSRLAELRAFLAATTKLQTAFIISRFDGALAQLLKAVPPAEQAALQHRYHAVAAAMPPYGLYALIDYMHFKGEGTAASERYANQGWGLLQVLQGMPEDSATPLPAFVASARTILARRVSLAPPQRVESRWLAGWNKRLDSYLPPESTD